MTPSLTTFANVSTTENKRVFQIKSSYKPAIITEGIQVKSDNTILRSYIYNNDHNKKEQLSGIILYALWSIEMDQRAYSIMLYHHNCGNNCEQKGEETVPWAVGKR